MAVRTPEIPANGPASDTIVADVDSLLATLGEDELARIAIREGQDVAEIVETLGLPPDVVAAVRLCPLACIDKVDEKTLKNNKLEDLSNLVSELAALSRFKLPSDWQPGEALAVQQSDALRKMLLAAVSDVRLVLARIAEQLCRLRGAKQSPDDVRTPLAIETREIYAPLASRLGVWQLKWELEDLAFRYLEPETYASIAKALKEKRTEREGFINSVQQKLRQELDAAGIDGEITGRPKHIYSIWRKMQRKDQGLESLYDIRAVRILVDDVAACYAALGVVHNLWPYLPGEFDDYIANPKENDYRSLHTAVVGPEGKTLEVQIRTRDMHRQAELGVAAHWRYKEGGGAPAAFDQKIRFLRQLLEPSSDSGDLLDQFRDDVFEDRVYAISPKGDVVELPAGATPLDFAYHVHTMVGHRCRGAKVNGRIVPLTYQVENGDKIEIITGTQPQPSRDWLSPRLGYLAGGRSRAKVRNWFRQQDRDQHLRHGREMLERELARLNIRDVATDEIAVQLKQKDTDTLCVLLGSGELTAGSIATALQQLREPDLPRPRRQKRLRKKPSKPGGVAVSGVGELMSSFAQCCKPVPPEGISGYITQGRGVSIHRDDCGNFLGLKGRHPERVIEVDWGGADSSQYPVDLTLQAYDRSGLIRDVTAVLADEGVNIMDLQSTTDKKLNEVEMRLSIEIRDLPTLSTAISRLEQLPNVFAVRRRS
ncbi:MAG: bifunctional (p)ppGpp synthetase/guanosine-3',5'-bis(diphosphate) 3'-pyrophosphohydrolase [Woeseiaceae bacterium]|nr:bifunctional (p)ppGpp synthetase/guanosine-3',5'-bis(diphosphate) 3'-pyrophosphohydrolase [Woeseiaceae bacterium]